MDGLIIISAILGFVGFLIVHVVSFRMIDHKKILFVLLVSYFISLVMELCIFYVLKTYFFGAKLSYQMQIVGFFSSVLLFSLASFSYVLAAVGITITSVRIQMLIEIATSKMGVTKQHLLSKYNKNVVVTTRLLRLQGSGEISNNKKQYFLKKSSSYFGFHTSLIEVVKKLYNRPKGL